MFRNFIMFQNSVMHEAIRGLDAAAAKPLQQTQGNDYPLKCDSNDGSSGQNVIRLDTQMHFWSKSPRSRPLDSWPDLCHTLHGNGLRRGRKFKNGCLEYAKFAKLSLRYHPVGLLQ